MLIWIDRASFGRSRQEEAEARETQLAAEAVLDEEPAVRGREEELAGKEEGRLGAGLGSSRARELRDGGIAQQLVRVGKEHLGGM